MTNESVIPQANPGADYRAQKSAMHKKIEKPTTTAKVRGIHAEAEGMNPDKVVKELLKHVPEPGPEDYQ